MQNEGPNRERKEQDTGEEIDRFEDFLKRLAQDPKEEADAERRRWEREEQAG